MALPRDQGLGGSRGRRGGDGTALEEKVMTSQDTFALASQLPPQEIKAAPMAFVP